MVRRIPNETIGCKIDENKEQCTSGKRSQNAIDGRGFGLSNRQHAQGNKRTILAIVAVLFVRTARHVG